MNAKALSPPMLVKHKCQLQHIPGPTTLPFLGEICAFLNHLYTVCVERYRRHGPVSRFHFFGQCSVVALDPECAPMMLLDKQQHFSSTIGFQEALRLRPSAPLLTRRTSCDVDIGGHRIAAHTAVYRYLRCAHVMPDDGSPPNRFEPFRFSALAAEHKKQAFQYTPFGRVAHKCLGMPVAQMAYCCGLQPCLRCMDVQGPKPHLLNMQHFP